MHFESYREVFTLVFTCSYDTGIEIACSASVLDRVVHELIRDEDESSTPYRIDMILVEYIPHKIPYDLGLRMVSSEVNLALDNRIGIGN